MPIAGQDIEIVVREGSDTLETRRCRTMRVPDGRFGAVWRGLVYPIVEGNHIDINGEAFPPAECVAGAGATPANLAFASIDGADEAYLLLSGTAAVREDATTRLRTYGITVLRAGRYLGEPVDGFAADWFIRFEKLASDEPLNSWLARILDRQSAGTETGTETRSEARARLLRDELQRARGREAASRAELAAARVAHRPAADTGATEAVLNELAEEQRLRHEAEVARATVEAELYVARAQLETERAGLTTPRQAPPRTRLDDEIVDVLGSLLPNVNLLRDSLTVAASEYASRKALYRSLAELASIDGRLPPNWKSVQGAAGWWERHVSDGQASTGRLYARYISDTRRWDVLISDKAEQPRDMVWIRRHGAG